MLEKQTSLGQQVLWWLSYSLGWVGISGMALWLIMQMRINLIDLNNFLGWGPWILGAVDKFGLILLGLGWLIGVLALEMYLRAASTVARLGQRLLRMFLAVGVSLAISYLLQWVLV